MYFILCLTKHLRGVRPELVFYRMAVLILIRDHRWLGQQNRREVQLTYYSLPLRARGSMQKVISNRFI